MHWDEIKGKWKELSGSIHAAWGELTSDEIAEIDGDRERLEDKLQQKYGKSKEEARKLVDEFLKKL